MGALIFTFTACGGQSGSVDKGDPESAESSAGGAESTDETSLVKENPGTDEGESEIPSASRDIFAMETYMTITCYGEKCEEALDEAVNEIKRIEEMVSVGIEESEIAVINAQGAGSVSDDTKTMIDMSLKIYEGTNGAFDITVYPLMELWGFTTEDYRVPDKEEITDTLKYVGSDKISVENNDVYLGDAKGIDLGGIAKGFTSDRLMEIFEELDLDSAVISLGGNVQLYKNKPDGSDWRCGIRDPFDGDNESALFGVLTISDCAVITSGTYERYFTGEDGKTYHHILDPSTGYPANNGLVSVSIVSKQGIVADGLSTACYVMGLDRAIEYWKSSDLDFDMILMTDEGEVYITEGIADKFETEYPVTVVKQ